MVLFLYGLHVYTHVVKMTRTGDDVVFEGNDFMVIRGKIIESLFIADFQVSLLIGICKLEEIVEEHILCGHRADIVCHATGEEQALLFREDYECTHRHFLHQAVSLSKKLRIKTDRRVI